MPVRFRCRSCNRLLGIARRKIGTQIDCPGCGVSLTVPARDDETDHAAAPPPVPVPTPVSAPRGTPDRELELEIELLQPPRPTVATAAPPRNGSPKPTLAPAPAPQPRRRTGDDPPLFEGKDFDALLGLKGGRESDREDGSAAKKKPVSGADALSLDDETRPLVLSPQKATLLIVAVVVLLGIAFAAGYLIAVRS